MSWPRVAASRVRALFGRPRLERELDDEVRFHLEMEVDANLARGMSPGDASNAALRSFGGLDPMKELYRDRRALPLLESTLQDIRFAFRTLRRSPAFTVAAVAVLALAIGANTAMFSVLYAVLLRPLPFPEPDRLAIAGTSAGRATVRTADAWRDQGRSVAGLAVLDDTSVTLTFGDEVAQISAVRVSPELFDLLAIRPQFGRVFTSAEAVERRRVALINYDFWQKRFGGSPGAIGASIQIDGQSSVIVGILPATVRFPGAAVWEPHTLAPNWETASYWFMLARLRPGVTTEQAEAELSDISRNLNPLSRGIAVMPLTRHFTGPRPRLALWMLAGAVFAVLLIAAANVAGLVLARSAARRREFATRFALGASRSRVVRQLLAESLTLAVMAGVLGLLIADAILRLIVAFQPGGLARLDQVALDPRALAASFAFCLLTAALVGLAPALTLGRRATGPASRGLRRALVAAEFAMAIVLLAGAGLFLRSLWNLQRVDPGFRADRVLLLAVSAPRTGFYEPALERISALPGVESAAIVSNMFTSTSGQAVVTAEGALPVPIQMRSDEISDGFFRTVGTPLLRGRFFAPGDGLKPPKLAIVNETMARRLWPAHDPVGQRFRFGPNGQWFTVVGVVRDMRRHGPESEPLAQMFEPFAQNPSRRLNLLVRTVTDDPLSLAPSIEAAVHDVAKHAPVYGIDTLERQMANYLAPRRLQTTLVVAFSAMALLIAAIGIYGLVQYSVTARTREIGIRIAIGARSSEIFGLVLREGMTLGVTGLAIGLLVALGLNRFASTLLFRVSATDPLTFLAVSAILLAVAAVACYFPARRAMKLDPVRALRID